MKKSISILISVALLFSLGACAMGKESNEKTAFLEKKDTKILVRDKEAWTTPLMFSDGFYFEIQNAKENVEQLGIGKRATIQNSAEGQERQSRAEEWGYSFYNLDGVTDGMGRKIVADWKAKDRVEAVEKIFTFLNNQYKSISETGVFYSMNGHYPFHHYAGEAGFDILGSEIGENINNYQWHTALNRGAARQYGKPWFTDFSMWNMGTILDYTDGKKWNEGSVTGGHSLSLFERSMIANYMAGASSLVVEGGSDIVTGENGEITPYGEMCKKINGFTDSNKNIGTSYTPFALVLDFYHGTYSGVSQKLAFNQFEYTKGDKMTDEIINTIWEGGIEPKYSKKDTEKGAMVNNTYGDVFDVLLQNASPKVLNSYPSIVLSGDIEFTEQQIADYVDYVKNGGVLVLNSAYKKDFPLWNNEYKDSENPYEFSHGEGSVVVFGKDYETSQLSQLLSELKERFVPFQLSEPVQHLVNVTDDSILLTLINNDGVVQKLGKETKISEKKMSLNIDCLVSGVIDVKDIYGHRTVVNENGKYSVELGSGEVAILEFKLK